MPIADVRGTPLFYSDEGAGVPLVLVHGFPLDSRMWAGQIPELAPHARVIATDLRGFGQSESATPFTLEELADDVHELLAQIGALPCVLAGLSMGGYVAQEFVRKYPKDLIGLVLLDTKSEADNQQGKEARNQMIELARSQGSGAVADKMEPKMLAESTLKNRPGVVKQLRQIMQSCPTLTIEHASAAMRDRPDYTPFLERIGVPVLFVVGDGDAISPPALMQAMREKVNDGELALIKSAGHMSPLEQPGQVNQVLRNFLSKL